MKSPKYILFSGLFFIFVATLLFLNIFREYESSIKTINNELTGIHKIIRLHNLNISLKTLRGLSQLNDKDAKELKNILSVNEQTVLNNMEKLTDKTITKDFKSIIANKSYSSLELFNKYTNLIKKLDRLRVETSQKYFLFFEHDKESYYLMMLTSIKIPEAIEYIGRLRGLIAGVLSGKNSYETVKTQTAINMGYFLEQIDTIKYITSKLPQNKAEILSRKINEITNSFYKLKSEITDISENKHSISAKEYFLNTSKLIESLNELFSVTENMLIDNLEKTKHNILVKIWINAAIYLLLILLASYATYRFYKKSYNEMLEDEKNRSKWHLRNTIRDEFMKNSSLKELCYVFLSKITDYFCALNGSMYIYDSNNDKLYLGAVYGIDEKKVKKTLTMHENIIGEVVKEKKTKIITINQSINLGNINIESSKLVTIPMIELNQCTGAMQLFFDDRFKNVDLNFLEEMANLVSSYIYKSQKDEISKNYFELIDKYVLISKTDYNGIITQVSSYFCELSGYTRSELIGSTHALMRHPDTPDEKIKELWETIKQKRVWRGEIKNKKKSGESFWLYTVITPDLDINGNIIGFTAIRSDITDKKYIEQISITDGLTSLYNRRHFDEIFPKQLKIAKRQNSYLAFAMVDIDKFKQYNDIYGHQEGDSALKAVANILKNGLKRADDYSFRLGGEEFGLLFKSKTKQGTIEICERIRQGVEKLNIEHKGNSAKPFLTISMGVVLISPQSSALPEEIYKKADDALYKAKNSGRNRVEIVEI